MSCNKSSRRVDQYPKFKCSWLLSFWSFESPKLLTYCFRITDRRWRHSPISSDHKQFPDVSTLNGVDRIVLMLLYWRLSEGPLSFRIFADTNRQLSFKTCSISPSGTFGMFNKSWDILFRQYLALMRIFLEQALHMETNLA